MSHTLVNYRDVEPVAGRLHFLREPLDCENLGLSVRELAPDETGKEHDHADEGQEEVYLLIDGAATIEVDGESITMEPGDALRVSPGATRQMHNGSEESRFIIVGAP